MSQYGFLRDKRFQAAVTLAPGLLAVSILPFVIMENPWAVAFMDALSNVGMAWMVLCVIGFLIVRPVFSKEEVRS